jgi:hypothetical protein
MGRSLRSLKAEININLRHALHISRTSHTSVFKNFNLKRIYDEVTQKCDINLLNAVSEQIKKEIKYGIYKIN